MPEAFLWAGSEAGGKGREIGVDGRLGAWEKWRGGGDGWHCLSRTR
jgi:hypothetical protein